jgi:glycosyltransferase involved in cell wall biosynthesis
MRVVVTTEYRFRSTADGIVWADSIMARPFWARYLDVFDEVLVAGRVQAVNGVPAGWARADGDGVSFVRLPHYLGPGGFARRRRQLKRLLVDAIRPEDGLILRIPSVLASVLRRALPPRRPYAVEAVGDPITAFGPGGVKHPLRPLFRWWFAREMRAQCAQAIGVAYVTRSFLQERYPTGEGALSTHYSSGPFARSDNRAADAFVSMPRVFSRVSEPRLLAVGTLDQMYKGHDVLIDALARVVGTGCNASLAIVGDGRHRAELESRGIALGLGDRLRFRGHLSAPEVRNEMDRADLFVMPSRTEGLPRALVEAMARALPCIGTRVGGIPELLDEADIVAPGDPSALSRKVLELVGDPARLARASARNLERAAEYREDRLQERRRAFYRHVRDHGFREDSDGAIGERGGTEGASAR